MPEKKNASIVLIVILTVILIALVIMIFNDKIKRIEREGTSTHKSQE